jgi:hypothetical protein
MQEQPISVGGVAAIALPGLGNGFGLAASVL